MQISVEKNWRGKTRSDARKIKSKLKLSDLLMVSSRRIPEVEFNTIADELLRTESVRIQKMDVQAIASLAISEDFVVKILKILGIDMSQPTQSPENNIRQNVAYAFSFFGSEVEQFRRGILEQSIIVALHSAKLDIPSLVQNVAQSLSFADNQRKLIKSVLDRMLQDGRIIKSSDSLSLRNDIYNAQEAMISLREEDWRTLRQDVSTLLDRKSTQRSVSSATVDSVMTSLGAIIASTGDISTILTNHSQHTAVQSQIKGRLRQLHATLDACAIPEGDERRHTLENLADLATSSAIGQHLIAGEMFFSLARMETPALIQALGAGANLVIMLDSSVSIPILSGLLHTPSSRHDSIAAMHVYEQIKAHNIRMVLPSDYLEETATHLIDAYRHYKAIIEDPDLRESTNAFVAHFASLRSERKIPSDDFIDYLRAFGFNERLAMGDFYTARNAFMDKLQMHFERYQITVQRLVGISETSTKRAQEAISHAQNEIPINRQTVVLQHDTRTIAFMLDQEKTFENIYILCTWDRLHFYIREKAELEEPRWHVLDPACFGDILSLAAPSGNAVPIKSPLILAMMMSTEDAQNGAFVWDVLVQIEKQDLQDAQLLAQARAFKKSYISNNNANLYQDVKDAWAHWKHQHIAQ